MTRFATIIYITFMTWVAMGLGVAPAFAQNVTCATRALGDSTNACASTAFVGNAISVLPAPFPGGTCPAGQAISTVTAGGVTTCISNGVLGTSTITGLNTTYTSAQNNTVVNRSNSTNPMGDTLPGTSPGILPANTIITVNNIDTAGVLSVKVGTGAAFRTAVASTGYVYICPGQSATFYSDGSNYYVTQIADRCVLKANTVINIATTGSATNDGLQVATPVADPTFAYNLVKNNFDLNGNIVTFSLATGTYSKIYLQGPLLGLITTRTSVNVLFQGNPGVPANVVISDPSAFNAAGSSAIFMQGGSYAMFNGLQVVSTGNNGLSVNNAGVAFIQNLDFHGVGAGQPHIVSVNGSDVVIIGNYTISSNAGCHWIAGSGAGIESFSPNGIATITITLTGIPAWTTGFGCVQYPSIISMTTPLAFSGTATGPRYNGTLNGVINTATGNVNFFPGNAAGVLSTGAQYN